MERKVLHCLRGEDYARAIAVNFGSPAQIALALSKDAGKGDVQVSETSTLPGAEARLLFEVASA